MDLDAIRSRPATRVEHRYDRRDTILYAIGIGYGADPLDLDELPFVYEEHLKAPPSICCVLAQPGTWLEMPEYRIDWSKVLHAEQEFTIHSPVRAAGHLRGESRIVAVEDRGIGRGALVVVQKALTDAASGAAIATVQSTLLLRGDGGSGGFGERISTATPLPPGAPERTLELATPANAALIYRLSGDYNPLHADPNAARRAGFSRPILHGLCTYGIACRAILSAYCGNEPSRLRAMSGRFSAPVYPGDSLRFEFHETNDGLRFRARVSARNSVVIDRGRATISA